MNHDDYDDDSKPEGLFDLEAINRIMEKASDALRPLGLTMRGMGTIQMDPESGNAVILVPIEIRSSAKKRLDEDRASGEEFQRMMAEQNKARIDEEVAKIQAAASDDEKLMAMIFAKDSTCEHRPHPTEGFCLDCGEGLDKT